MPPEERYRERKNVWYIRGESSGYIRGAERYDGYGCTGEQADSDGRDYAETAGIEDEEIIDRHTSVIHLHIY